MKHLAITFMILLLVGCGNKGQSDAHKEVSNESTEKKTEEVKTNDSAEFKEIDIKIEDDNIKIDGNAKVTNGVIYYSVEQEGKEVYEEKKVVLDDENMWMPFTEKFSTEKVPNQKGVVIIELYGKDNQGQRMNPNYIPADLVQMK